MQPQSFEAWLKKLLDGFYEPVIVIAKILIILILSFIVIRVGSFIIKKLCEKKADTDCSLTRKKINTMATLMTSVLRYSVYIIAIVIILTDVFKMTSVIAAAGVGGIALGFGAQSLIRDIISGFFIVMEDQYAVGDMITLDSLTGTVENLELRVTKLRSFDGDLYIIPNGEIKKVINHTRGNKTVIVDIPISYKADINKAFEIAGKVCGFINGQFNTIIVEEPSVLGITKMDRDNMNLRIIAKTLPNEQWKVERAIRKQIAEEFSLEGIEFARLNRLTD